MAGSDPQPPARLLAWVEETVGRGARVVERERLTGGLTSNVHRVTIERNGGRDDYVLRWWLPNAEQSEWMARAVRQEAAVLAKLEGSGVPAPRLIGSAADATPGGPALLMTMVPGTLQLMPADREDWLRQMARMLARIHSLGLDGKPFESWLDRGQLEPPPDARRPRVWQEAIALVGEERASSPTCFLHRDYQHFNLLWSDERLTGVVDWSEACLGPPEVDVGHCRLNITLLFSADAADRFRAMYEAEAGRRIDAWWDVHALLSYGPGWRHFLPIQIDGRAPLDIAGMTQRMEEVLDGALRQVR